MRAHTRHAGGSARLDLSGRRRDAADFPVMVEMAPQQGASGIMLRNPDAMPVYGQVRVYAWEQRGGDDVLLPTDEIQVSPHHPGAARRRAAGAAGARVAGTGGDREELSAGHRRDSGSVHAGGQWRGAAAALFGAGVRGRATPEPRPELSWKAAREGKEWVLSLNNTGTRYAQVASLQVLDSGGKPVAEVDGLVGYALAQRQRQWRIPGRPQAPGPVRIKALINGGTISATPRMD